eukprot:scaffold7379_cov126-Isochrysis_galbana.AAC.8
MASACVATAHTASGMAEKAIWMLRTHKEEALPVPPDLSTCSRYTPMFRDWGVGMTSARKCGR